ncbi:hypothetical protein TWF694_004735 [Orbilia ellipsospora]|uniref:Apple domain-containing protein n=1 Tax=Orbilia ellipsospora TaxID=2528407 RepID=A0AAV9WY92_9PEZI
MLFSAVYSIALLALSSTVLGQSHCIVPPASCKSVVASSSSICLSLISSSHITRPTCTVCTKTATPIVTTKQTTTISTSVTSTKTVSVYVSVTQTVVKTNVATHYVTATSKSVSLKKASTTITKTTTVTTSIATTSLACVDKRELDEREIDERAATFPPICSCFLTSTTTTGTYTILLTSFLQNATVYHTIPVVKTTSKTLTTTVKTISKTVTAAVTNTIIHTSVSISTSTSTITSIVTSKVNKLCAAAATMQGSINYGSPNVVASPAVVVNDFTACCNLCFSQANCSSYEFIATTKQCILKKSKAVSSGVVPCKAGYCPLGKQPVTTTLAVTGHGYGTGPCFAKK